MLSFKDITKVRKVFEFSKCFFFKLSRSLSSQIYEKFLEYPNFRSHQ